MSNLKFSNTEEPFYDATIDVLGTVYYRNKEGQCHRLDGPAIEGSDGYRAYYVNGKLHRLDGPAIIYSNGNIEYWVNDKLHRLDGPALIWINGKVEYYINGEKLTKEEFDELTKENNSY